MPDGADVALNRAPGDAGSIPAEASTLQHLGYQPYAKMFAMGHHQIVLNLYLGEAHAIFKTQQ
jgi:hypothetical protein